MTTEETITTLLAAATATAEQLWRYVREHPDTTGGDLELHARVAYDHLERAQRSATPRRKNDDVTGHVCQFPAREPLQLPYVYDPCSCGRTLGDASSAAPRSHDYPTGGTPT